MPASPFASFFMAGFECSTLKRRDGRRLDLIAATQHDLRADADYAACAQMGMRTVRDGLRWHLIERSPGVYGLVQLAAHAAGGEGRRRAGDLGHLPLWLAGVPGPVVPQWVESFTAFAEAAARVFQEETGETPLWCPVNEISFFTWSAGDVGYFFPAETGRGPELKRQLVRAGIAAAEACLRVDPRARFIWCRTADQDRTRRPPARSGGRTAPCGPVRGLRHDRRPARP